MRLDMVHTYQDEPSSQQGFTLVEVMISIVVAMVVLAGLMTTFISQSSQYKYQNKRIDTVQDLEFGLKFIEEDLRSALIGDEAVDISSVAVADLYTFELRFKVWDETCVACVALAPADGRILRVYEYDKAAKSLKYDREGAGGISTEEILPNVTFFKVFDDYSAAFDTTAERSGVYTGMPDALPRITINATTPVQTNGYTILVEIEVDIGYKGGSLVDVLGNPTATKRVWRYVQVYPLAAVN